MVSCKFCYQKTFCVIVYDETVYVLSYRDALHGTIFSPFLIWEFFCISKFFVDPIHNVNYKGKRNSDSKSQDEKTQFESKRHKSDY